MQLNIGEQPENDVLDRKEKTSRFIEILFIPWVRILLMVVFVAINIGGLAIQVSFLSFADMKIIRRQDIYPPASMSAGRQMALDKITGAAEPSIKFQD